MITVKKIRKAFLLGSLGALSAGQLCLAEPQWPPQSFSCYYGPITPEATQELAQRDLIVVHPGDDEKNLDSARLSQLRSSGREKTLIAYVTIGEDDRPPGGPPLKTQDLTGPSYSRGSRSKLAKNGYPSRFLDQRKFVFDRDGFLKFGSDGEPVTVKGQDGHPDENGVWGSYYVNAANTQWRKRVYQKMDRLKALGVDGFFLDTVDTASPWGDYGWTAPAMLDFVRDIRKRYPRMKIVANRGLFYLDKDDRYAQSIDAVLFESMLTHYNWDTDEGEISPWAKWHIESLKEEVAPSQERTGLHLLVLDYLNPKQKDALHFIQADRSVLSGVKHSLAFSHPGLKVPGWTDQQLLPQSAPTNWPTLKTMKIEETGPGLFRLMAEFDAPLKEGLEPDLRVDSSLQVKNPLELRPSEIRNWWRDGSKLYVIGAGLDQDSPYRFFLRLISRSASPQSQFAWTDYQSKASSLLSQAEILNYGGTARGLALTIKPKPGAAKYRVYKLQDGQRQLLAESTSNQLLLDTLEADTKHLIEAVGVNAEGQEGYPSEPETVIWTGPVAPAAPAGPVTFSQSGVSSHFSWTPIKGASSYRLYVVPKGQKFRLPALVEESEIVFKNVVPGVYTLFLTTVDDAGNQSRPGPKKTIRIR